MLSINGTPHIRSGEAARRAGVSQRYISLLAKRGLLAGRKIACTWYVEEEGLITFIKQRSGNGSTKP